MCRCICLFPPSSHFSIREYFIRTQPYLPLSLLSPSFPSFLRPSKLDPRENLGVTGPSGCGKSSLALLLTRMYAPQQGRVFLDGFDISTLDPSWLRRTVVVITQEVRERMRRTASESFSSSFTFSPSLPPSAPPLLRHGPGEYRLRHARCVRSGHYQGSTA